MDFSSTFAFFVADLNLNVRFVIYFFKFRLDRHQGR